MPRSSQIGARQTFAPGPVFERGSAPQLSRFFDARHQLDVVKIKPGEFFATSQRCIIATVLGSCVAACIRDTVRGGAGMNHFMLAETFDDPEGSGNAQPSLRFGAFAMESLINEFVKRGSRREDLEAKVFGGATLRSFEQCNVGAENAKFVIDYLATERIRVSGVDLGGTLPRKILLFVETGRVLAKYLPLDTTDAAELSASEAAPRGRFMPPPPQVELF